MGLDPLKSKSDGKTKDNKRKFDQDYTCDDAKLTVSGDYRVSDIAFQESDGVFNVPNAVSPVYEIYMQDQKFDSAVITFDYTPKNNERLEYFSILMMEATHLFRKERRQNSSIFQDTFWER